MTAASPRAAAPRNERAALQHLYNLYYVWITDKVDRAHYLVGLVPLPPRGSSLVTPPC